MDVLQEQHVQNGSAPPAPALCPPCGGPIEVPITYTSIGCIAYPLHILQKGVPTV